MHGIFYLVAAIGILGYSALGATRSAKDRAAMAVLHRGGTLHNETMTAIQNRTTIGNETLRSGTTLDLAHPVITMQALYEHSRQQIHQWMEMPHACTVAMSALVGVVTAMVAIVLFCLFYSLCSKCYFKRRQHRITNITNQYDDGKNFMEPKVDDCGNDII